MLPLKQFMSIAVLLFAGPAVAASDCALNTANATQTFFVSGVLQKIDDAVTIKLVQSIEPAESAQEAMVRFVKQAAKEYPAYKIVDALISQSDEKAKTSCLVPVTGISV
jgi:hypothetical protein